MRRALPLLLAIPLFALAPSPAIAERDDDDHHGVKHDCGGSGCHGYIDLRIDAFVPQGPDAPANLVVYAGRTPQAAVDGIYRISLTDAQGRWIEDDVDLSPLKRAPFALGSYVVLRLGGGRYVHGVFGFMKRGNVYVAATATTAGPRVLSVKSFRNGRFERQGDHQFVANNPNQDEFEVAGQVTTVHATASTHADLVLTRVTCRGADLCANVTCTASDQCHEAGVCDASTGRCSNPAKADNATCDDGNACTQTDTCQSGQCVGANPKTCVAQDQCHGAGACDPATGDCSSPQLADETPCEDGLFCTKMAWCQQGACVRQTAVVCDAAAECHEEGVCDDVLRKCVYGIKGDGADCSDGNACTLGDYCMGGLCLGNLGIVSCPSATQCLSASTCDPADGSCNAQEPVNEAGDCNDGVNCTTNDKCQQGTCAGTPVVCGPGNACSAPGVCVESAGACYYAPVTPDPAAVCAQAGAVCGDVTNGCGGSANCGSCPIDETCAAGQCIPLCASGLTYCSGTCRNLAIDAQNCGACGRTCGPLDRCDAGQCAPICGSGAPSATEIIATIPLATYPANVAVDSAARKVYVVHVTSPGNNAVSIINPNNDVVTASIPIGQSGDSIGLNPVTHRVYVSKGVTNSLAVIEGTPGSPVENTLIADVAAPGGRLFQNIRGLGVDSSTNRIYVPSFDPGGQLVIVDGATNTVSAQLGVAANPIVTAYNPTTGLVYAGHGSFFGRQQLTQVNASGATSTGATVGLQTNAIAVDPGTNRLYVHRGDPSRGSPWAVVVVNAETNAVLAAIPVDAGEGGVAINPVTHAVYVASSLANTVSIIDGQSGSPTEHTVIRTLSTGLEPRGVGVDVTTGKVYVANAGSNAISVLKAAASFCLIENACIPAGTADPSNPCQVCAPAANPQGYSARPDGIACPDDGNPCTTDLCAAGSCAHSAGNGGTVCRAAAGSCDVPESCDGVSTNCPADQKSSAICRAAAGVCDVAESCDGVNNDCPADQKSNAVCRAAAGVCDVAESCDGVGDDCPADQKSIAVCRAAAGVCDVAESCDGVTDDCPVDLKSTEICRAAAGLCDVTESCDGAGDNCPANGFQTTGVECRAAAGVCDVAESCTGSSAECPADAKSTSVCRASAGLCDVAESCDGTNNACPSDGYAPSTTECRASANACDPAETCSGAAATCPADVTNNGTPACTPCTGYTCLRDVPAMIYFGGYDPTGLARSEAWALLLPPGGTPEWIPIPAVGTPPPGRLAAAGVYDSARDRVLFYGGHNQASTVYGDVWALSLNGTPSWTQLSTTGAAPVKSSAGAAYRAATDQLFVTMGGDSCSTTTDALSLAGAPNWAIVMPGGSVPPGRTSLPGYAYDEVTERLFLHGGQYQWPAACGGCPGGHCTGRNDTHVLSLGGSTPTWTAVNPSNLPPVAGYPTTIWDPVAGRLVRFGGSYEGGNGPYDSTWLMSDPASGTPTWTEFVTAQRPQARYAAPGIYDRGNRRMLISGGRTSDSVVGLSDLWSLDLSSAAAPRGWSRVTAHGAAPNRVQATVVYVPARACATACTGGQVCRGGQCVTPDSWTATTTTNAPIGRSMGDSLGYMTLWTGKRMIVWGGQPAGGGPTSGGALYDPLTNSWTPISTIGAPTPRYSNSLVWTGTKMIVWGGESNGFATRTNTGGRYDPETNTWEATSTTGAPTGRIYHGAVWTGSRMLVWGGLDAGNTPQNTGGSYDPVTDTWTTITTTSAPSARQPAAVIWSGSELLIWGGGAHPSCAPITSGGRYDPVANVWTPMSTTNAPQGRFGSRSVWTGSRMLTFGGGSCAGFPGMINEGGLYDPATNTWTATTMSGAPSPREAPALVWTGTRAVVWGGINGLTRLSDGFLFDPVANAWSAASSTNAPEARYYFGSGVWTGRQMLVWGGNGASSSGLNTGGVYTPP